MIEFNPYINENTVIYRSFENGAQTGCVLLTLDSSTHCSLRELEADNNETAEGLIRSALTAAANRNSYACNFLPDSFADVAKMLGFVAKDNLLYGEIPFLLAGCCGCKHNKMT